MLARTADRTSQARATATVQERWLELTFIVGFACVFVVNGVTALLEPASFTDLVADSAPGRWLGAGEWGWVGPAIAVHDLVLGLLLLSGLRLRRLLVPLLAWSGVWLLGVAVVRVTALDAIW